MQERDELEAALAAAWDRDTLAVYADCLLAEGDPRGELIALDLEIEAHGNTAELTKRRTSLLYSWLGGLVPVDNVHAAWVGDSLKFGFVDDLVFDGGDPNALGRLEQVLESAAGPYIRGLTITGATKDVEAALGVIGTRRHEWLTRVALHLVYGAEPIDAASAATLVTAMPRLSTLVLAPVAALAAFSHPTITRLEIRGAIVYAALANGTFPAVRELVLDLNRFEMQWDYDDEYGVELPQPEALPNIAFPALRRLDVSRTTDTEAAYELLRSLDARAHVTHLVISQLRNAADREELIAAIRDMRALEVVEVAHGHYYEPPDLPNVRLVRPERWPWPTPEETSRELRIYQPHAKFGDTVTLRDAAELMERSFEALPKPAREAWSQFWKIVATLQDDAARFPARLLADAVDACPELMQNGWRELREELSARRPLAPDATVTIELS